MRPIVHAVAASFGQSCEVILHDLRQPDSSVVEIAGHLTARRVGAPVSEVNSWLLAHGQDVPEKTNKLIRTAQGRILKSTLALLRGRDGKAFGAFCINIDVTELTSLARQIGELAGSAEPAQPPAKIGDDMAHVVQTVISAEQTRLNRPLDMKTRADRVIVLSALEQRGVLSLRRAVPRVAAYLAVSRATIYSYIRDIRDGASSL